MPFTAPEQAPEPAPAALDVEKPAFSPVPQSPMPFLPPQTPTGDGRRSSRCDYFLVADVALRAALMVFAFIALVLMASSNQDYLVGDLLTDYTITYLTHTAKFQDVPAFVYFVSALALAVFYALGTGVTSLIAMLKRARWSVKLLPHFVTFDALFLGVVAAAAGAAGGVSGIGSSGNSALGWGSICGNVPTFCTHVEAAIAFAAIAAALLVLLIALSVRSLFRKIPK